jgi:UDP-2,3-diacylglucosamine hydrolase
MKTTLFISDLHLEESRRDITDAFLDFLGAEAEKAEALYVLGDFFEAWVGDDEHSPLQVEIIRALRSWVNDGHRLFFMHGNRDFLIRDAFAAESGATLLTDPTVLDIYAQRVLLLHGDSLCTRDLAYMKFRANMRNPQWQALFLARPLADRKTTAQQLRAISMAKNQGKKEEIMDVTPEEVSRILHEHQVLKMIHGHTHRPAIHDLQLPDGQSAQRIVLGDWDKNRWFLKATEDGHWDLRSNPKTRQNDPK